VSFPLRNRWQYTIHTAIPGPTTSGAHRAQNPLPRRSTTSPSLSRARVPHSAAHRPPLPHKAAAPLRARPRTCHLLLSSAHHVIWGSLSAQQLAPPWPPPAASPRRSASHRCPAAAPPPAPSCPLPNAVRTRTPFRRVPLPLERWTPLLSLVFTKLGNGDWAANSFCLSSRFQDLERRRRKSDVRRRGHDGGAAGDRQSCAGRGQNPYDALHLFPSLS
jgi:hypothetical protein